MIQDNQFNPVMAKLVTQADSSYYEKYSLRPYNPDDIYQKKGDYSLFYEMREDDQVGAVLSLKKFFIISGQREVQCKDPNVKEFIEWNIDYYYSRLFEESLLDILSALDFGFSMTEKMFKLTDTPKWGKKIVLDQLRTRPPDVFEFDQDSMGDITQIRQHTTGQDISIPKEKIIHYQYQSEFDNPYGRSELNLGIYRAWWSKNAIIKFWNIYLERFGMPTTVASYPAGMSNLIDSLKQTLKNIQAKTSIIIPEEVKLDLLALSGTGQTGYERAIDKYNIMIARKMLVPDLAGMSGAQTSGGSYALGTAQFNMFYNNIQMETRRLERMINREIIRPLVSWNFGPGISCEIKLKQVDEERKFKLVQLWTQAVQTGQVPVEKDHLNWFYKSLDMPEIKVMPEIKTEPQQLPVPEKQEQKEKINYRDFDCCEEVKTYRSKNKREREVNFEKIEKQMDDLEKEHSKKVSDAAMLMINAFVNDIKNRKIIEKKRLDLINKIDLKNVVGFRMAIKDMLWNAYQKGGELIGVKKYDMYTGLTDEEVAQYLEQKAFWITDIESNKILNDIKGVLIGNIKSGNPLRDVMLQISEISDKYKLGMENQGTLIETIVRTNISDAYNQARVDKFKEYGDRIVAYQYSAIIDTRTTALCKELDGKIIRPEEVDYYNTPNHFNCRSILIPIFSDEEFEGFTEDNAPPPTESTKGQFIQLV